VKLPEDFDRLSREEQETVQETMRRRIVYFYYAALTMKSLPDHFDAIRTENYMLRAKLFKEAQAPYEGDSVSLKYPMLQILKNWPMSLDEGVHAKSVECPVHFSEAEVQQYTEQHHQEQEKLQELGEMREFIGTDALSWVPDDDELERCRAVIQSIKDGLMEHSSTEIEKTAVLLISLSMTMKKTHDVLCRSDLITHELDNLLAHVSDICDSIDQKASRAFPITLLTRQVRTSNE
jgi:hypothetical protein